MKGEFFGQYIWEERDENERKVKVNLAPSNQLNKGSVLL